MDDDAYVGLEPPDEASTDEDEDLLHVLGKVFEPWEHDRP